MAQAVIQLLDMALDVRLLSDAEFNIRAKLKKRLLGWAVIERARKRQALRIRNLREGDASKKYFHLKVNAHRRKNFIQHFKTGGWTISRQDKSDLVQQHYATSMLAPDHRKQDINWDTIVLPRVDLSQLDRPFDENEIAYAISQLPYVSPFLRTGLLPYGAQAK
jgi:hypothetical protein